MLTNALTLVKLKVRVLPKSTDKEQKIVFTTADVLVVEHRFFFSDAKKAQVLTSNKKIIGRLDKRLQGLVKDMATESDFEKGVCYEAFQQVYSEEFYLALQPKDLADHFALVLRRGVHSGNLFLDLTQMNADLK